MNWPNNSIWKALASDGERVAVGDEEYVLSMISCGELTLPSGKLVACDPFACLQKGGNVYVSVPPGRYPVYVTLADVSDEYDGSHIREAYASLVFANWPEVERKIIAQNEQGGEWLETDGNSYRGFPVDAGTACFVDDEATEKAMPADDTWLEELFENGSDDDWFHRMDDPQHIRGGIANIPLPLAQNNENIVIFHSGWGDGVYPVIGGYDEAGEFVAIHIDFMIVGDFPDEDDEENEE